MSDLRACAATSGVGFVDVIHELDARRDLMVNWVHLKAQANDIVAKAFARTIRADLDRAPDGPAVSASSR